jgi:hypothetical protein
MRWNTVVLAPNEIPGYEWGMVLGIKQVWNPLTDDGDALRLAVKLGLFIQINSGSATAWKWRGENWYEQASDNADDMSATTRRAIVRAAAEIGRDMTWHTNK